MHPTFNLGGEGASTHFVRRETSSIPALVALTVFAPTAAMACGVPQDIYRIAYERTEAALRPSPVELATRFIGN
jgi:hypothetical protein